MRKLFMATSAVFFLSAAFSGANPAEFHYTHNPAIGLATVTDGQYEYWLYYIGDYKGNDALFVIAGTAGDRKVSYYAFPSYRKTRAEFVVYTKGLQFPTREKLNPIPPEIQAVRLDLRKALVRKFPEIGDTLKDLRNIE